MNAELTTLYGMLCCIRHSHDPLVLAMLKAKSTLTSAQQDTVNRCISSLRVASDNLADLQKQLINAAK